jgi:hypothetical protein
MDKIGKHALSYLTTFFGLFVVLAIVAVSMEGGHPSPAIYVVQFMGIVAVISMPVVIYYSLVGINKANKSFPRYSAWKCVVSLIISLLFLAYFTLWFMTA